jgi:Mg2+ and Co2+ transporter CorA
MFEERGLFHLMGRHEQETIERGLAVSFADIYDHIDDALFEISELEKMLRRLFRGTDR